MDTFLKKHRKLSKRDIHVWKFDVGTAGEDVSVYEKLLSKGEKERASKFKFTEDRERFLWGRIQLKRLLGAYLDKDPDTIILNFTSNGKPILENKKDQHLQFNISHSGDFIILGFSRSPIGVDVEKISRRVDVDRISRNYFSDNESKMIETVLEDTREIMFYDIWTKKEAVIKGIGKGFGIPLKSFSVLDSNGHVKWKPNTNAASLNWFVHSIDVIRGYKAAFATPIEDLEVSTFSLAE